MAKSSSISIISVPIGITSPPAARAMNQKIHRFVIQIIR